MPLVPGASEEQDREVFPGPGTVVVVSVWSHRRDRVAAGAAALPGPVPGAETLVALPAPLEAERLPVITPGRAEWRLIAAAWHPLSDAGMLSPHPGPISSSWTAFTFPVSGAFGGCVDL